MVKVKLEFPRGLMDKIQKAPEKLKRDISFEVTTTAPLRFRELAVKDLTSGMLTFPMGWLADKIIPEKVGQFTSEVTVKSEYAPYIEWGTITRVQVPSELKAYAIQFKGKGIRKTGGIYPRPYFFKQEPIVRKETEEHILNILSSLYD